MLTQMRENQQTRVNSTHTISIMCSDLQEIHQKFQIKSAFVTKTICLLSTNLRHYKESDYENECVSDQTTANETTPALLRETKQKEHTVDNNSSCV